MILQTDKLYIWSLCIFIFDSFTYNFERLFSNFLSFFNKTSVFFKLGIAGTLLFNKPYYNGTYKNLVLEIEEINVNGYEDGTKFDLKGGLKFHSCLN